VLIYSMGVSLDGYIADRDGGIGWSVPGEDLFRFHVERVGELGAMLLGRRLYDTMLVWETDPALRESGELEAAFADLWAAIPKVVFSRSLDRVEGNARLATSPLADEIAAVLASTDRDVEIGGAELAGQAIALGLVDEVRSFRYPVLVGGGTPLLPALDAPASFELVESRVFDSRVVYERHRRTSGSHD
jgi:dihydrofolate reductase